jgi:hypothetical protein
MRGRSGHIRTRRPRKNAAMFHCKNLVLYSWMAGTLSWARAQRRRFTRREIRNDQQQAVSLERDRVKAENTRLEHALHICLYAIS